MYDIFVNTHFSSGHYLRDYPGSCERPHGHNWKVTITVRASEKDSIGMGIDFTVLKQHVKRVIDLLDHKNLNEIEPFDKINPSSENIAEFIFEQLYPELDHDRYKLYSVSVFETDQQGLTYYGHSR